MCARRVRGETPVLCVSAVRSERKRLVRQRTTKLGTPPPIRHSPSFERGRLTGLPRPKDEEVGVESLYTLPPCGSDVSE